MVDKFLQAVAKFCCLFWTQRGPLSLETAGMHFDTFSLYFSTLRADISAPVNPRGLKSTLLESEQPSDSIEAYFNPSTLEG